MSEERGLRIRVTPRARPAEPQALPGELTDGMDFGAVDSADNESVTLEPQLPPTPLGPDFEPSSPTDPSPSVAEPASAVPVNGVNVTVRPGRIRLSAVRKRVREAMRCPYCRDAVTRQGAAACAKAACGALYHQECWEECSRHYGGCAVFACGSTEAHGLTRIDFAMRTLRLLLAVLLFPPRVISAVRELRKHPDGRSILKGATKKALKAVSAFWGPQSSEGTIPLKLGLLVPGYALVYLLLIPTGFWQTKPWLFFPAMFGVPIAVVLLSYALAVLGVLGLGLARSFLAGEFELLTRVAGGYMGKMAGGGKKK